MRSQSTTYEEKPKKDTQQAISSTISDGAERTIRSSEQDLVSELRSDREILPISSCRQTGTLNACCGMVHNPVKYRKSSEEISTEDFS
ncbi:hypothetical protein CBS147333_8596 [Penicillium roqueforti]|nr:hypothetical protein CBS147333_8596 [Penicillium roqueforti]KAI3211382.1 hypothetical protein CBS147311_1018 [Penicillium roqueforti]KAI3274770.1 hypothetical protein CBS147308_2370 [Penicillium roqueforti]KAI3294094.1 hypothetical protein DTO003C3_2938 [Penicillium roqueforti]